MGTDNYLDLRPDAVVAAGNQTAGTASDWSGWASHSETMLRNAADGARSTKVSSAFQSYLSQWRPALRQLATRAETLGHNAVSAARTLDGADGEGASLLRLQTGWQDQQEQQLHRPINALQ